MRGVQAACPACAGPVRFRIGSALVAVCGYCRTVVARTDRKLEDLGKVAAIVESGSPLHLGLKGKYQGKSFLIVGRVQYQHAAGGVWDEWYAAFPGGKWGWLAEAMGRFYLTFEKEIPESVSLPGLDGLAPGQRVTVADQQLSVAEVGRATVAGAEGEMPFVLHPGEAHDYADLYGTEGRFVTLDFGAARPTVFVGRELTLEALGLADAVAPEKDPRQISGLQVNCPQCAGPLSLKAPDQTKRVICPNCHASLDCQRGNLQYLETLDIGKEEFAIPVGTVGTWNGVETTVIGAMRRSVTFEGRDYFWSEYLLYAPRVGFRWLVESEQHWSYVEAVSPGEVVEGAREATVSGDKFKLFQQASATVRYVVGEFYWKVSLGETVYARDFIAPPRLLSIEHSSVVNTAVAARRRGRANRSNWAESPPPLSGDGGFVPPPPLPLAGDSDDAPTTRAADAASDAVNVAVNEDGPAVTAEINYSLSTYVSHEEVERAFGVVGLDRGWAVAPNQPPPVDGRVFLWWAGFVAALFLFYIFGNAIGPGADGWLGLWAAAFVSILPVGALFYRHSFEVSRWKDSEYTPYDSGDSDSDDSSDDD